MPAIIGVLPILVYAGYAAAAALAAALLTSCDGGKAHDTDGDLRPDDDGKNPVDDDAADTDGIQDSPEVDVSDDDGDIEADLDGGADDDTHDDDTDPACEGRAGFNPCVAKLAGSVGDIDDSLKGLAVFGGSPASVYVCETEGLASASCTAKATLPAGLRAAQFSETPFGYWVATATPEGAAVPVSFFHIDDAASSPASAVLNRKDISQITVGSGSDEVVLDITRSGGIAVFEADEEPSERFFLGLDALSDGASTSLLGNLRNFDGDFANMGMPAFTRGVVTGGVGSAVLDIGEGEKEYIVAVNAGRVDASDAFEAGFSVIDASGSSPLRRKNVTLGEAEMAPLPEIAFGPSGRNAWVAFERPQAALKLVNLESGAIEKEISLGSSLSGSVTVLVASGARLFVGDSAGKVLFVDTGAGSVEGSVELSGAPTACAMRGEYLYCGVGGYLAGIDPNEVELE